MFDVLFRLLRHVYGADNVVYARNITDVDDKINARAAETYPDLPPDEAIRTLTDETIRGFHADTAALGCLPPTHEPRATDNIPGMIALVESLLRNGHAYEAAGEGGREVLFDVASMPDYGALSRRKVEDQRAGARVEVADHKRHPADFVLWKEAAPDEPGWESPFGRGRPGWHLECSAMSDRYLWDEVKERLGGEAPHRFDIHGGGIDLAFPHHENEIAQTRCGFGTEGMANVWMHNGFLQVEGRKMSKSEGNFVTVHDLLHTETFGGRRWPGEVLRLAMLMSDYREPIDFSVQRLAEARKVLLRWGSVAPYSGAVHKTWKRHALEGIEDLAENINTGAWIATMHEWADWAARGNVDAGRALNWMLDLLGLPRGFGDDRSLELTTERSLIETRVEKRRSLLTNRNFAEGRPHPRRTRRRGHPAHGHQGPRHRRAAHDVGGEAVTPPGRHVARRWVLGTGAEDDGARVCVAPEAPGLAPPVPPSSSGPVPRTQRRGWARPMTSNAVEAAAPARADAPTDAARPIPRETPALDRWPELRPFVREVVARYSDRLHAVLLYGSRARGEERADSDHDVGVVLEGKFDLYDEVGAMADIAYDSLLASSIYIQARPLARKRLASPRKDDFFARNVAIDGITLVGASA